MKMAEVCHVFNQAGMQDVSSVLATGNIIFSSQSNSSDFKFLLEKALSDYFNYEAHLFLKTAEEVKEIVSKNPFIKNTDYHIYSFIGNHGIEKILNQRFSEATKEENEEAELVGQNFYWQIKKGLTLDSQFGKILGNKNLKSAFTSRNRLC